MSPDMADVSELVIHFSEFRLDFALRRLYRNSESIKLGQKPFNTLEFLVTNRHRVVSKEELLEKVWGARREVGTVEQAVRQLRKVLGDDAARPQYIETVAGQGYRFVAPFIDGTSDITPPVAHRTQLFTPVAQTEKPQLAGPAVSRRFVLAAAGCAAVAAMGIGVHQMFRRRERLEGAVLTGNLLTAVDGFGRTVWSHRFPEIVESANPGASRVQVLDLEGNRRPGILVACSFLSDGSDDSITRDELFYFKPDGTLAWSLPCEPDLLDCNGHRFESGWGYTSVLAVPSQGEQTIWAGVRHRTRFPGCVLRVDAHGKSRVHLANAGNIQSLCRLHRSDGEFIVFSGVNNAFDRTCLGLIGINDPPASSPPAGLERYRFANAAAGLPRIYILLPTVELSTAGNAPYGHVQSVVDDGARIVVDIEILPGRGVPNLLYQFSRDLAPDVVMPAGSCPLLHRKLEEQGALGHSWSECPELAKPHMLRRFTPSAGWRMQEIRWRLPTNTV